MIEHFPGFTALGMDFKYGIDPEWTLVEGLFIVKGVTPELPYPVYALRTTPGMSLPEGIGLMTAYIADLKEQWLGMGKDDDDE